MNDRIRVLQRQPRRISITLSYQVHQALLTRSEEEGRSLSNLCAFLLEEALRDASRMGLDIPARAPAPPMAMKHEAFRADPLRSDGLRGELSRGDGYRDRR